ELEPGEGGVRLAQVVEIDPDAERAKEPHAADAEDDLLRDAVLGAAAVEALSDPAVGLVHGLEEVERRQAEPLDAPRGERDLAAPHQGGDGDAGRREAGARRRRKLVPHRAALAHALDGVALGPEDADAGDGKAHVAGRLDEVPREDAEPARKEWQSVRDCVFHTKIRYAWNQRRVHSHCKFYQAPEVRSREERRMPAERRRHERVRIRAEARVVLDGRESLYSARDLSLGGAFLSAGRGVELPDAGKAVELSLCPDEDAPHHAVIDGTT